MGMKKPFTKLAGGLLALVAIGHGLRLALGWGVTVAGWTVPMWPSAFGLLVPALLAVMLWREARTT